MQSKTSNGSGGSHADRRRFTREPMDAACKLFHRAGSRFIPARMRDVSSGGVRITLKGSSAVMPGDRVDLALGGELGGASGGVLVRSESLVAGRIVRIEPRVGGRQHIAIAFDQVVELKPTGTARPLAA